MRLQSATKLLLFILFIVFLVALILLCYKLRLGPFSFISSKNANSISTQVSSVSEIVTTKDFTFDMLHALSNYHFASLSMSNLDTETSDINTLIVSLLTELMNTVTRFKSGDSILQKYTNSPDNTVSLISQGILLGSSQVQKSNNDLIDYIKNADYNDPSFIKDFNYAVAKKISSEKEGYGNIIIYSGQSALLFYEPARESNPSGPIPYRISKSERQEILKEIDRLFADPLSEYHVSTDNYNAVIIAVDNIRKQLTPDTYEEARVLEKE